FHATQSPLVARTTMSENQARSTFYGMMVVEGVIGMIWAGAGMAIYNMHPEYMSLEPATVLSHIATHFLGSAVGKIAIIGVVILAITSGDTALRSLRLSISEMLHIPQKPIKNRLGVCSVLLALIVVLIWWSGRSASSFNFLWNYFAWGNQVIAASTLMAASVWLARQGKNCLIALLPGAFMTYIVCAFILWTSSSHAGPFGFGLPLTIANILGVICAVTATCYVWKMGKAARAREVAPPAE
ncbi:MAG: hypothetical protein J6S21_01045, partial [Victivallales bacterium]|nr:hypothetical protein [Victivallales bacterium]